LPSDYQYLTKWLLHDGLDAGTPEIACVLMWYRILRNTQGPTLQCEYYESCVCATVGITLSTGYRLWHWHTLTFSDPEKYLSSVKIMSVY
jgi:hypothetical protein